MTPERWREVEHVYQSTMDRDPRLRAAFLSEACAGDDELRREVDSLLELNHSPVLVDEPASQAMAELLTDGTPLAPGTQLGPYRIETMLGAGGMGRVYQSHDTRLGRTVALKIPFEEFNERFEREARAVAALNHPNVCTIHDVGPNYLVMELVEGPTLSERIEEGPIPLEEALRIARQVADALEAAHEKGIVHRDLKPGNIKIKPDGTVKVLDFGLAKLRPVEIPPESKPEDAPTIRAAPRTAGMILGTPAYMSPEQARGKDVDKRADIWAFGVVLHEMLTSRRLFEGEDVAETLALVLKGEPKWDGIPANVQRLLKSCLEKNPSRRLRDIGDAWRILEAESNSTVASRPRLPAVAWIVAAVAVGAVSALAFAQFRAKPPAAEVVQFQISLPARTSFTFGVPHVSPDGRRVAYIWSGGGGGRNQLWVRSLDSLEAHPLAGTEGAYYSAFWSPDSRYLGFAVEGKLKKVEASGGAPLTLCDLGMAGQESLFRGGTWSRDGLIIFGASRTGLWRVSATGGAPARITMIDRTRAESVHTAPDFLPDGRHFLYERFVQGTDDIGIYLGSLDARPEQQSSTRLLTAGSAAVYAPAFSPGSSTGHLLFTREGSLMAQAFDLRRLALEGEAIPIAEDFPGGPRPFSASVTGVLAYRTGGYAEYDSTITQLTWFDRGGKVLATAGDPGQYSSVALSPDGTRAAVSRVSPQTARGTSRVPEYDIWVHDFARGTNTRITSDPRSDWLATWSPDGNRLIFSSERGSPVFNLYQKASNGAGNEDLLFKSNQDKSAEDWSRDGKFLLYSVTANGRRSYSPPASNDLWVLPLTPGVPAGKTPELYLKTEFNESQGRFSPDTRFIAYTSAASGRDEIYVQPFPTAQGGKTMISRGGGVAPRWRGDGKELYYISADSEMMAVEVSTIPVFKAGTPKVLFHAPIWGGGATHTVTRYDVTADGKRFLINSPAAEGGAPPISPITVVLNWTGLLKK